MSKHPAPLLWRTSALLLALAPAVGMASNCEAIQKQIEARIQASGATGWTLATVPADKPVAGKVVGQCDLGRQKIVYQASASAPARSQAPILTECKDGTVSLGGDCPKRP
ncbi:MAG: DUF1161 domain-containing protein [Piscinibacter sp.]